MNSGIVIKETGSNIISFLWGILSLCFDHLPQASSELDSICRRKKCFEERYGWWRSHLDNWPWKRTR